METWFTHSKLFQRPNYGCTDFLRRPPSPWRPDEAVGIAESNEENAQQKNDMNEKLSESSKLKGVLWPGMDLFDSATPEMKRMRNQRKDSSVLEQMMATSSEVEAVEVVYRADGKVSHARDIFGPLSTENSPVSCHGVLRTLKDGC